MSESIQTQGKTVDEAIAEACLQLGLRRDEVDIRVTQEPKSGLLGFLGGRPAKVVVRKKPARRRGGNNNRNESDGAHSLGRGRGGRGRSRGGRGRGSRGRGGRDNQQANQSQNEQSAAPEAKRDNERNNDNRGRGGRQAQGGRGRGRGGAGRGRNNDRQDAPRSTDSRRDSRNNQKSDQVNAATQDTRETTRNEDRGGRDNQRRSRRGGRGRSRRNNPQANENPSAAVVNENANVNQEQQAPQAAAIETPVASPTPVETAPMTTPPKPAAEEAPVVKKKKRGGWGGGLGSRLKSKTNPAVKEKPAAAEAEVSAPTPELTAPAPTPTPERQPRYEERSRRPSDEIDEVIASGISATKYAAAATGVTEENLDSVLSDMTNGVLARAGFSCEVNVSEGEYRQVKITSDDESAGLLIGRHGQTVDAVEHLIERMVSNSIDDRVRMNLDINEYRQRRQEDLAARVAEAVESVRESGKVHHMESMSARERRLVHLEAEGAEGIRTFTMSGNGGKHVVLAPDDEDENDDRHDG